MTARLVSDNLAEEEKMDDRFDELSKGGEIDTLFSFGAFMRSGVFLCCQKNANEL